MGEPLSEAQADATYHVMDILVSDIVELLGRLPERWISQLRYADSGKCHPYPSHIELMYLVHI